MRRRLSLTLALATVALAVGGFLGGSSAAVAAHESGRALTSPLTELQSVPAGAQRVETAAAGAYDHDAAVLGGFALALAMAAGAVVRERRRCPNARRRAWSAPRRGPPRLAAL